MQLNHPGKQSSQGFEQAELVTVSNSISARHGRIFDTPREATSAEIEDIIQRFGRSAAICKKAGFGGVQIHGAHGYLISQFLSPHHNQRTDQWGGNPDNRRRFVMAVYEEIRRQVGARLPGGYQIEFGRFPERRFH